MARKHWYFGRFGYTPTAVTSNQMLMLPAPDSGLTATRSGYVENMAFENGGAGVVRSAAGARTYECDFGVANASGQSGLDSYTDMQQGYFGYSPVYVSDAMNYTTNVFPPNWAAPGVSQQGWKPIYSSAPTAYPARDTTVVTSYAWLGDANASPSVQYVGGTERRRNLIPNPVNGASSQGLAGVRATVSLGSDYARGTINDATTGANSQRIQIGSSSNTLYTIPVTAGVPVPFSLEVRSSTGLNMSVVVYWFSDSGTFISAMQDANVPANATTFTRYESTQTPPANASRVMFYVGTGTGARAVGDTFDVRRVFVGDLGTYFDGSFPSSTATDASNPYRQPAFGATYNVTTPVNTIPTGGNASVFIPIPPRHSLYMGVSGTRTGTGIVQARPVYRDGGFAPTVDLTMLSPSGATRLNTTFSGETFSGVVFYITRTTTAASTVTLTSLMAQIYQYYAPNDGLFPNTQIYPGVNLYPTASSVYSVYEPNGYFIPGRGQSGMEFSTEAIAESYTLVDNSVTRPRRLKGMSFTVTEVTPWRGGTS